MKKLLNQLETRTASVFCMGFALLNRIIFTSLYSTIGRDTKVQLTYAENLLAGKGMGVVKYFSTDLNTPVFDTHWLFPPGLSIVIIPFLKIFSFQEYKAILVFDILAAILFVIAVKILGKRSGLPDSLNNIVVLIAGCSQYPFFMSASSTDVISLDIVLFSLAAMMSIVEQKKRLSSIAIIGYSFLFFLPSFFRYMYLPVTILFPLLTCLSGLLKKNRELIVSGTKVLIGTSVLVIILLTTIFLYSGSAAHVYDTGRGVFFDQVIRWYPFLPASVINLDFAAQLVERVSGIEYTRVMFILEILNAVLFILLCFLLFRFIFRNVRSLFSTRSILITGGSSISILIILMLAYLSLTYKAQDWGEYKWTYSYDIRYFAFIYILVPLLFFAALYFYPANFKNIFLKIFVSLITITFTIEVAHGIYYNAKIVSKGKSLDIIRDRDKDYRTFQQVLLDLKDKNPGKEIIVCAPDQFYLHTASQMGYKAVFDYINLNNSILKPASESILLMPVHKQDAWIVKHFVEKNHPEVIAVIAGTTFYKKELEGQ